MSLSYSFFPDISGQCLSIIVIRILVIIFSLVVSRTGFPSQLNLLILWEELRMRNGFPALPKNTIHSNGSDKSHLCIDEHNIYHRRSALHWQTSVVCFVDPGSGHIQIPDRKYFSCGRANLLAPVIYKTVKDRGVDTTLGYQAVRNFMEPVNGLSRYRTRKGWIISISTVITKVSSCRLKSFLSFSMQLAWCLHEKALVINE